MTTTLGDRRSTSRSKRLLLLTIGVALLTPMSWMAPPPVAAATCFVDSHPDNREDVGIDATSYSLGLDCDSGSWTFAMQAAAPLPRDSYWEVVVYLDTDRNGSTGCVRYTAHPDGFDYVAVGTFDGRNLVGAVKRTPGCDGSGWTTVGNASLRLEGGGSQVLLSFAASSLGAPSSLAWRALANSESHPNYDNMPSGTVGAHVASGYPRPASDDVVGIAATPTGGGYWSVTRSGRVQAAGDARDFGSMAGIPLSKPVVGVAPTPSGGGYWLVATDGGIFSFGNADFYGSTGDIRLNQPIVGMASTPSGRGYWFVAADGGVFSFGDAPFLGSMGGTPLTKPVVGMASCGSGYWLVASDGGIFSFGCDFFGSTGDIVLNRPITAMTAGPGGRGYWFTATDGGIFSFGDAPFRGSTGASPPASPIVGMAAKPDASTYWLVTAAGSVFTCSGACGG
jgi:hypothetical protein